MDDVISFVCILAAKADGNLSGASVASTFDEPLVHVAQISVNKLLLFTTWQERLMTTLLEQQQLFLISFWRVTLNFLLIMQLQLLSLGHWQ